MYMVTVVVTDAGIEGKGKLSAERDVVVTVTNINEGAEGTVVTLSSLVPKVGVPLTATLDDPDGGEKDIGMAVEHRRCYGRKPETGR